MYIYREGERDEEGELFVYWLIINSTQLKMKRNCSEAAQSIFWSVFNWILIENERKLFWGSPIRTVRADKESCMQGGQAGKRNIHSMHLSKTYDISCFSCFFNWKSMKTYVIHCFSYFFMENQWKPMLFIVFLVFSRFCTLWLSWILPSIVPKTLKKQEKQWIT